MNKLDIENKEPAYRVHRNKWSSSGLYVAYSRSGPTFSFHFNWPLKTKFLSTTPVNHILMLVKNELL
jgi:hypothetical protein